MKKASAYVIVFAVLTLLIGCPALAADFSGKKILFVDSYHEGYAWSEGIIQGVKTVLNGTGVELKIHRMDSKRNPGKAFKIAAGKKAKAVVDSFQPDLVITSDDIATNFLAATYLKGGKTPVVFCGVNWDASKYGFPCKNVTGILEVSPIPQLMDHLKPFARGTRLGYLSINQEVAKNEAKHINKEYGYQLEQYYSQSAEDWKKGFLELQKKWTSC